MHRRVSAFLLLTMLLCDQVLLSQTIDTSKTASTKPAAGSDQARIMELANTINVLTKIKSDPQFTPEATIKDTLDAQIHQMTCERNKLLLRQSLSGSAELKKSVSDTYYAACIQAPTTGAGDTTKAGGPPNVPLPQGCLLLNQIAASFGKNFDTQKLADNSPIQPSGKATAVDRSKQVPLNATESGGEINTKSTVYLAYINRVRYTVTLGGTVTAIAVPTIPTSIFPTAPTATTTTTKKPPAPPTEGQPVPPPPPEQPLTSFDQFNKCFGEIQGQAADFQSKILTQELRVNDDRAKILGLLNGLQPVVSSLDDAQSAANVEQLPKYVEPHFPIGDLVRLREVISEFANQYVQFKDWDHQSPANGALFDGNTAEATRLGNTLDQYLGKSSPGTASSTGSDNTTTTPPAATTPGTSTKKNGSDGGNTAAAGVSCPAVTVGSKEVIDYEANVCFVESWRLQFRTVAGEAANKNVDYFITDFKPVCGGFFGQGTSTQMQMTTFDGLNPTVTDPKPVNIDKVVCQPAISISNGLGLSFIPDQTPAFVPSVQKDAQGNPVLDSKGNPVIVQSLGYSSQANVRPAYALQVNVSLWTPQKSSFEFHWSVGAMLTAATGGATTDVITGPTMSFKKRAFFVSPMYDLGLRTTYVPPFAPGMPQGNLTSPPTHQVWKSGFGLTLTFPFSTGTNTTQSSSGGKTGSTGTTDNTAKTDGNTPKS